MAAKNKITEAFDRYAGMSPVDVAKESKTWFNQQMVLLGAQVSASKVIGQARDELSAAMLKPGSMYMYKYQAEGAADLDYWDVYPLVIPFNADKTGFHGLNLHYLEPQLRAKLLGGLYNFATNNNLDENTKLRFSWQMAMASSKVKYIQPCVKKYLYKQVRSQFMKINPTNWIGALMLPTETFKGANKAKVWAESRRM